MADTPCQRELSKLKTKKIAYESQVRLLESFVAMANSSQQEHMLKATMQETLELATEITIAEKASVFLLDDQGTVIESILAREDASDEEQERLIGKVLAKGLAGWVQQHRQVALVEDTSTDSRWLTLPEQPYQAGSALAVPLLRGEVLFGILTMMHSKPGHFKRSTVELIQMTADQMALVLENVMLYQKLDASYRQLGQAKKAIETYSAALDRELATGRQIQRDFLPEGLIQLPNWAFKAFFAPARQVAGDFYDVFRISEQNIGWVIGDVCGKGVGSALYMALFRSLVRVFSGENFHRREADKPLEALQGITAFTPLDQHTDQIRALQAIALINDYILENHSRMCMFATLFFGALNPQTGALLYINAGHEPPVLLDQSGSIRRLKPTGPSVGIAADGRFGIEQVTIAPGQSLIGFTDGVTEALSPQGEMFGRKRLYDLIGPPAASVSALVERIQDALAQFCGQQPPIDDITIMALQHLA